MTTPTHTAFDVDHLLHAGPLMVLGWLGLFVTVAAIGARLRNSRASTSPSTRELFASVAHAVTRIGLVAAAGALAVMGASWLEARGGAIAGVVTTLRLTALLVVAELLALFLMRQVTAPPWWRLNAWESTATQRRFGVRDAIRWIVDDVRDLLRSVRLIDQLVVGVALPLTMLKAMQVFGTQHALAGIYRVLGVLYIALVVALMSANRIPRVLMTRLQDLRHVTRRIATGDLAARVAFEETGEYEELAQLVSDVNGMARVLQTREQENQALTTQLNQALQFEQERASRDPLTQLRNHRYFQEALAAELYRCSRTGETTTIAVLDLDDFKAVNDTFGHQEGDAVLIRTAQALTHTLRPYDLPARLGGEEFGIIFPSASADEAKVVMDRIMQQLASAGPNGAVQTFSGGIASFPQHATDQSSLFQYADSASYAAKLNGKKHTVIFDPSKMDNVSEDNRVNTRERDAQLKAARTLVQTVDAIEDAGNAHSEHVGQVAALIARAMGWDDAFAQQVYLCGLLHDVGKLGIDHSIVRKAGRLTAEEFEQVKRHPELSAQIVSNAGLGDIADWVRHHHEHWDGTGYPHGLASHDIPPASRMVLVAEAFDVMTTDKPYRMAMPLMDAVHELQAGSGTRFDPHVVATLVELIRQGEIQAITSPQRGPDTGTSGRAAA